MFISTCVLFVIIYLVYHFRFRWKNSDKIKLAKILNPGYASWPIIGHLYLLLGNSESLMVTFQSLGTIALQNDGITSLWLLNDLFVGPKRETTEQGRIVAALSIYNGRNSLVINDPEIAEIVMKNCLEKHDIFVKIARLLIGNGSGSTAVWRHRRKLIAPTFSSKNMIKYMSIFASKADVMVKQLHEVTGTGNFSIWNYVTAYSMDSVCESTMGVNVNVQKEPRLAKVVNALCELTHMASTEIFKPWMNNELVFKLLPFVSMYRNRKRVIDDFIDEVIQSKREELKEKHQKTNTEQLHQNEDGLKSFLELFIESTALSNEALLEETKTLLYAGTDTTAASISFTMAMLARHPDVQEKVYQELCEVFGDSPHPITGEYIVKLKYLEMVIKESLRLYPPGPLITRQVDKDIQIRSDLMLPKGCGVLINIMAIHRNPKYWGADAEVFRPERFINEMPKHPAAYIPFSYGPRGCPGYQFAMFSLKTTLASMLKQYRIMPPRPPTEEYEHHASPTTTQYRPLRLTFEITMKDKENFIIQLENRQT